MCWVAYCLDPATLRQISLKLQLIEPEKSIDQQPSPINSTYKFVYAI